MLQIWTERDEVNIMDNNKSHRDVEKNSVSPQWCEENHNGYNQESQNLFLPPMQWHGGTNGVHNNNSHHRSQNVQKTSQWREETCRNCQEETQYLLPVSNWHERTCKIDDKSFHPRSHFFDSPISVWVEEPCTYEGDPDSPLNVILPIIKCAQTSSKEVVCFNYRGKNYVRLTWLYVKVRRKLNTCVTNRDIREIMETCELCDLIDLGVRLEDEPLNYELNAEQLLPPKLQSQNNFAEEMSPSVYSNIKSEIDKLEWELTQEETWMAEEIGTSSDSEVVHHTRLALLNNLSTIPESEKIVHNDVDYVRLPWLVRELKLRTGRDVGSGQTLRELLRTHGMLFQISRQGVRLRDDPIALEVLERKFG